jgi:exopolyphosphatase/guanosine-5'-triphosphate,3'-diphosphate pyrophosphatase
MTEIIPRWEWRTFGTEFGPVEAAFAAMTPEGETNTDEVYLLAPGGANVKIRADLLDIKELRETDDAGLERWLPVMKRKFPLNRADVAAVASFLGIPPLICERDTYSRDQFLEELIRPIANVQAVKVQKHRVRYLVGGCMSEVTTVRVDGLATRTVAVESEDRLAVIATARDLGLDVFRNTSYPQGLGDVIEGTRPRYAVIDVGTNSVKFNLGERTDTGTWVTLVDRAEVTRLGEDLEEQSVIIPAAIDRTATAIASMVDEATGAGAVGIVVVGTAGMRLADNTQDVIAAIRDRVGPTVEVISSEEEGRLAYVAVQASMGLGTESLVVFDTGGGSSQFTFGVGSEVDERFSVNVGAVRYTEQFGLDRATSKSDLGTAAAAISENLSRLDNRMPPDALVGMGGSVTNIAAVSHSLAHYDPDVVQGTVLYRAEINRQIGLYGSMDASGRRSIVGLQKNRAGVILAGALIVRTIMDKLAQESMTVSDRGLRHGLIVERFGARLSD